MTRKFKFYKNLSELKNRGPICIPNHQPLPLPHFIIIIIIILYPSLFSFLLSYAVTIPSWEQPILARYKVIQHHLW